MSLSNVKHCILAAVVLATGAAKADPVTHGDKLKVLYSNQFAFNREGVPLITVRIAEGIDQAVIESSMPLRVFPDGQEGAQIRGGNQWVVRLRSSKPAKLSHSVVLARAPVTELSELQAKLQTWTQRGARCRLTEMGTIFGVKGKVFDNRGYVLTDGPYSSQKVALSTAESYKQRFGLDIVATQPTVNQRPTAVLEARNADGNVTITVRDALWFAPSPGARLSIRSGRSNRGGKSSRTSYWGNLYVTVDRSGQLAIVNAAPAHRLLAGLVPAEIFPTAAPAALRAQAVAARGELLAKLGTRHRVDPYLLCAEQHCQVYRGAGHEQPSTTQAVTATRGQVLVREDGRLVDTVYSAMCGGHTEHNNYAWPTDPDANLRGRLDAGTTGAPSRSAAGRSSPALGPFRQGITAENIDAWLSSRPATWCNHSRYNPDKFRWVHHLSATRAAKLLAHLQIGEIRGMRVLERGVSGRATILEVLGTRRRHARIRGELNIRRILGGLRSSMFLIELVAGAGQSPDFVFRGGGWGHGVGMCQTGAIAMGESGLGHQQILRHYYRRSQLQQLY